MKKEILATLAYSDIFDYPLTIQEVWQWLIMENLKFKTVLRSEILLRRKKVKFKNALESLLKEKHCVFKDGFYFLPARETIVAIRRQREEWSEEKIRRAKIVAQILRFIPWIKLIGLTGTLARKNTKKDDDIDLFFIIAQNRLWISRGLIVLILRLLRLYRRPNKVANMICPNMFVAEDNLKMKPPDLFMAHEVCLMGPIFVRDDAYSKFLQANSWVKKFLPNAIKSKKYNVKSKIGEKRIPQILDFRFYLLDTAERLAKQAQLWYMRQRRTTEVVSDNLIKFHPQDARGWILREYQARLQKFFS